jgi:hypothetical protein
MYLDRARRVWRQAPETLPFPPRRECPALERPPAGVAERVDLGVRRRVVALDALVVPAAEHGAGRVEQRLPIGMAAVAQAALASSSAVANSRA